MTRSPEAIRFLELLLPEFIMASVLGLFYTLLNGGILQSTAKYNPPGEYTPLCALTPTLHTNTHTQSSTCSIGFIFPFMHLHLYTHTSSCVHFTVYLPLSHTHTRARTHTMQPV